jgi:hypothetical protein
MQTPSPVATNTATLPVPPKSPLIKALNLTRNCLPIETNMPVELRPEGKAIIWKDESFDSSNFWDFKTGAREIIPGVENIHYIAGNSVSPNHKLLVPRNVQNNELLIIDANATTLQKITPGIQFTGVLQWLTDQTLALWDNRSDLYLYSLKDGLQGKIFENYQDLPDDSDEYTVYEVNLDPTASRLVYQALHSFNLLDVKSRKIMAEIPAKSTVFSDMVWSNDGNYLYMLVTPSNVQNLKGNPGSKLLKLDRNGALIEWIGLDLQSKSSLYFSGISLSPDQNHVSFWLNSSFGKPGDMKWELVVIDLLSQTVKDYCIPQVENDFQMRSPWWSPDGKQLIVETNTELDKKDMALLDISTEKAYLIAKGAIPVGWMAPADK